MPDPQLDRLRAQGDHLTQKRDRINDELERVSLKASQLLGEGNRLRQQLQNLQNTRSRKFDEIKASSDRINGKIESLKNDSAHIKQKMTAEYQLAKDLRNQKRWDEARRANDRGSNCREVNHRIWEDINSLKRENQEEWGKIRGFLKSEIATVKSQSSSIWDEYNQVKARKDTLKEQRASINKELQELRDQWRRRNAELRSAQQRR